MICDSPAGIERGATLAMRYADAAIIVTNPEVSSVRDSDRIIGMLDSKTEKAEKGERVEKHLLITRYDAARAARGEMLDDRRHARNPLDPAARHHPGEPGRAARLQCRLAGDAEQSRQRARRAPISTRRGGCCGETVAMTVPAERKRLHG